MSRNEGDTDGAGPGTVSCEVCRKQVPRDEAQSPEGRDYVIFLCGLECFATWQRDREQGGGEAGGD